MSTTTVPLPLTTADIAEAKRIWKEYQLTHDVTSLCGQAAGIDPRTGEIGFGDDIIDIHLEIDFVAGTVRLMKAPDL